jgi:hypothetical protein
VDYDVDQGKDRGGKPLEIDRRGDHAAWLCM